MRGDEEPCQGPAAATTAGLLACFLPALLAAPCPARGLRWPGLLPSARREAAGRLAPPCWRCRTKLFGRKRKRLSPASPCCGWQSPPSCAGADLTSFQSLPKAAGLPARSPPWRGSPRPASPLPHNFSPRRPARPACKSCERRIVFCLPRKASGTLADALKPQTNKQQLCKGAGQTSPAGNEAQDLLYFNPAKGLLGSEAEPGCAELRMKPYF